MVPKGVEPFEGAEQDNELIERTLNGEPQAFNLLVRRWERQIYALAFRMLGREEEAYDICQETFMSAYRNLSKFRGEAKFSSWLYRIALNCCHTRLRSRGNSDLSLEQQLEDQGFEPATNSESLNDTLHRDQIAGIVKRALAGLPPEMRQVIIMKEYQGLKFHEIAEILNIPVSTVKTRVYTGLEQLKQRLSHLRSVL
ncbi:MAG: sigma-70 family RNA polymerase sigma factor [Acidobacteria bacterium]|nr:sigma-70 family RNA polymerase sigma factor [Acidobacteriota bacterium]